MARLARAFWPGDDRGHGLWDGTIRKFGEAETKAAYEKVYNAHASYPCSLMPRLGANKVLTIEQIKDTVALLMSPESQVNK